MGISNFLGSPTTDAAAQVISFTTARQEVIANNIANIDTPGYRMRDLDVGAFNRALSQAMTNAARSNPNNVRLSLPSPEGMDANGTREAGGDFRGIVFHDDNDRSIEQLTTSMVDNFNLQRQAVNVLRSQLRLLRSIIAETPQSA
ncbi:MAG: flagellar basal body protein [Planctomycetota bacterium]